MLTECSWELTAGSSATIQKNSISAREMSVSSCKSFSITVFQKDDQEVLSRRSSVGILILLQRMHQLDLVLPLSLRPVPQ